MGDEKFERFFQIKENDAWVIKGMLANGGDPGMIARVFHADQAEIEAIAAGTAWLEVQYPGRVPYPDE